MDNKERREFRREARRVARQAVREGTITRLQRGQFLLELRDDEAIDEMADVCLAQAVKCGVIAPDAVNAGAVNWPGFGENIDWKKLAEFIKEIIAMFVAL